MKLKIILLLLFFYNLSSAQIGLQLDDLSDGLVFEPLTTKTIIPKPRAPSLSQFFKTAPSLDQTLKSDYNTHLAFFCRVEVQLEKAAKFPIKFRLGDVDYVDWLEGKSDFKPY